MIKKYQIISLGSIDIKQQNEQHIDDINGPIVEPIPALVEYIKDKYDIDTTKEINEYEEKINRDKKE